MFFFIYIFQFIKTLYLGIKEDTEFRFLFVFINLLLISSTIFYTKVENWAIIDAFYFSVMTMSTVGYGDFVPTTLISKIFTIIYTFLSIGTFVAFTAKMIRLTVANSDISILNKKEKEN